MTRSRRKASMMSQYNVPEDLIEVVFRRLPLKSLARFKCLSKTWNSRISEFKWKPRTLAFYSEGKCFQSSINGDETRFEERVWRIVEPRVPRIAGSCNGLLLLVNHCLSFSLWNPFTGYYKHRLLTYRSGEPDIHLNLVKFGFYYDTLADDYKVIVYTRYGASGAAGGHVSVGSLKTKNWRKVRSPFNNDSRVSEGPLVRGHVHWSVASRRIVYFDPVTDEFKNIPTPKLMEENKDIKIGGLGVLDGCLCVSCWHRSHQSNQFEVMAMKEYGVAESWTSLLVLDTKFCWREIVPLCFTSCGEILILMGDGYLVDLSAYNPTSRSVREIKISKTQSDSLTKLVTCEQSLLPPPIL